MRPVQPVYRNLGTIFEAVTVDGGLKGILSDIVSGGRLSGYKSSPIPGCLISEHCLTILTCKTSTKMIVKLTSILAAVLATVSLAGASPVELQERQLAPPAACTFVVSPSGTPDPSALLFSEWNYSMSKLAASPCFAC